MNSNGRGEDRVRTAPQEEQVLSLWPEAPHLGQSLPCMFAVVDIEFDLKS